MENARDRFGLNAINFCAAAVQTGFGPFLSVYLTEQIWNQTDIGLILSINAAASLFGQVPAGALVDAIPDKRLAIAGGLIAVGLSALLIASFPILPVVAAAPPGGPRGSV